MTTHILAVHNYLLNPFQQVLEALSRAIKSAIQKTTHLKNARRSFNELNMLSNRELNDIGLSRGDIWTIAYGDTSDYHTKINDNLHGHV
jgi:uncharacterized protein YjiS (DUF1127 family)